MHLIYSKEKLGSGETNLMLALRNKMSLISINLDDMSVNSDELVREIIGFKDMVENIDGNSSIKELLENVEKQLFGIDKKKQDKSLDQIFKSGKNYKSTNSLTETIVYQTPIPKSLEHQVCGHISKPQLSSSKIKLANPIPHIYLNNWQYWQISTLNLRDDENQLSYLRYQIQSEVFLRDPEREHLKGGKAIKSRIEQEETKNERIEKIMNKYSESKLNQNISSKIKKEPEIKWKDFNQLKDFTDQFGNGFFLPNE